MSWRKCWLCWLGCAVAFYVEGPADDSSNSINNKYLFSLDRITLALQTAARLSQQAELGGILEEIEVSFKTSTRWCCFTVLWFTAWQSCRRFWAVLHFNTFFAFCLSGPDSSFGWSWWPLPPVWRGTWGDCHVCDCCLFPVRSCGHGAPSEGGMISVCQVLIQVLYFTCMCVCFLFFLNWRKMCFTPRTRSSSWWTLFSARNRGTPWLRPSV